MISVITYAASQTELMHMWKSLPAGDFEWVVGLQGGYGPRSELLGLQADSRIRLLHTEMPANLMCRELLEQAQGDTILPVHADATIFLQGGLGCAQLDAFTDQGIASPLGWAIVGKHYKSEEPQRGENWQTTELDHGQQKHIVRWPFPISAASIADPRFASPFWILPRRIAQTAQYSDANDARQWDGRALNFDLILRTIATGAEPVVTKGVGLATCRYPTEGCFRVLQALGDAACAAERPDSLPARLCARFSPAGDYRRLYLTAFKTQHPFMETLAGLPADLSGIEPESVGEILVENYLPFLSGPQVAPFLEECYRILHHGGWLRLRAPSTDGPWAWANPLYRSFWNATTFTICTNRDMADAAGRRGYRFYKHRIWQGAVKQQLIAGADLVAIKRDHNHPGIMDI